MNRLAQVVLLVETTVTVLYNNQNVTKLLFCSVSQHKTRLQVGTPAQTRRKIGAAAAVLIKLSHKLSQPGYVSGPLNRQFNRKPNGSISRGFCLLHNDLGGHASSLVGLTVVSI